jgi:hypothetical protein
MPTIRREINILNSTVTTASASGSFSGSCRETVTLNSQHYYGTSSFSFEIVGSLSSGTSSVVLRRSGSSTDDATIVLSETSTIRKRVSFTPPITSSTNYVIYVTGSGINPIVTEARLIVSQIIPDRKLYATEGQFEIADYIISGSATSSAPIVGTKYWYYTASNWSGYTDVSATACWKGNSNTAIYSVVLQVDNGNFQNWTTASILYFNSSSTNQINSASFIPINNRNYRLAIHANNTSSFNLYSAKIVYNQSIKKMADLAPLLNSNAVAISGDGTTMVAIRAVASSYAAIYYPNPDTSSLILFLTNSFAAGTQAPSGSPSSSALDYYGRYLAISHLTSPYISTYVRATSASFQKLINPTTLPTGTGAGTAFSQNAEYLAVGHLTTPFITIYSISGSGVNTRFQKIATPTTLPPGVVTRCAFTSDGNFLAACHTATPFVTIYSRSGSGTTSVFTKLVNPTTLPAGAGRGISFTDRGDYLAVAHVTTPFITLYEQSGSRTGSNTRYQKIANPDVLPTGNGNAVSFNSDGSYLAASYVTSPFLTIYTSAGRNFTALRVLNPIPNSQCGVVQFNANGNFLAVSLQSFPSVSLYKCPPVPTLANKFEDAYILNVTPKVSGSIVSYSNRISRDDFAEAQVAYKYEVNNSNGAYGKIGNVNISPSASGYTTCISSDSNFMVVGNSVASPYMHTYARTGSMYSILENPSTLPLPNSNTQVPSSLSSDGTYMVLGAGNINSSSNLFFYKYSASLGRYEKLSNPTTFPDTGLSNMVSTGLSADGTYCVAAGTQGFTFIHFYKLSSSNDTYTKLINPNTLPSMGFGEAPKDCSMSSDGEWVGMINTDFAAPIDLYQRSSSLLQYTRISNPSTLISSMRCISFSESGSLMAIGSGGTPFFAIYSRSASVFTKIQNPTTLPTLGVTGIDISKDGNIVILSRTNNPYLDTYIRTSGSGTSSIYTRVDAPYPAPPGGVGNIISQAGKGVALTYSGSYLSVAHDQFPYVSIYSNPESYPQYKQADDIYTHLNDATIDSTITGSQRLRSKISINIPTEESFIRLTQPNTLPPDEVYDSSWSPDCQYLAVTHKSSPYLSIYKNISSGSTELFAKVADPTTLPIGLDTAQRYHQGCSMSSGSLFLAVSHDVSPFLSIYSRSFDTFTKITNPATLPVSKSYNCCFSADSNYLAVAASESPYTVVYSRSASVFTRLGNIPGFDSRSNDVSLSNDGSVLAVGLALSPFIHVYLRSASTFTKIQDPVTLPSSAVLNVNVSNDGKFINGTTNISPFFTPYTLNGTLLSSLTPPTNSLGVGAQVQGGDMDPTGKYISLTYAASGPYVNIYKNINNTIIKIPAPNTTFTGFVQGGTTSGLGNDGDNLYLSLGAINNPFLSIYKFPLSYEVDDYVLTGSVSSSRIVTEVTIAPRKVVIF